MADTIVNVYGWSPNYHGCFTVVYSGLAGYYGCEVVSFDGLPYMALLLNGLVGCLTWLWCTVYGLKGLADMIIKVYVCWLNMAVSGYGQVGWLTWFCLRMVWLVR